MLEYWEALAMLDRIGHGLTAAFFVSLLVGLAVSVRDIIKYS
jgi:hypothetical protein